ncbi:tRNA (N(6)-L-threonylcarbamoyladenosine(37)-C(2))-methylthiotransferase MtaB [Bartonella bovis]|uniref:tRNA modification enzyme, MiaB family n=1 Tax=Bartonella bovis 91-4 TaxID=1094491 RepID=N6VH16_9HYPH|nr:tRNA (N(6)-L-threonylcarbamoyladenosine(37)-C(2))-methylthiotransferase MtaB [Bartonella bovis]ENN90402.1 tRNA modification enzyme, MiaB family [Bartonella bovis 91-4]
MAIKIVTFGCRLNSYESEIIREKSASAGLDKLKNDAIIFNTCAVTAEAVRQAKQAIRKAKRENPHAHIVVTGCAAQTEAENFALMTEVDLVLGNEEKLHTHFYRQFPDFGINHDEKLRVNDIMEVRNIAPHMVGAIEGRTRAFVQVQNGCDHRCTFCIIPYSRGPSRSVPMGTIIEQIKQLIANGVQEIVLTGVDLTSYGTNLPGKASLGKLVSAILHHVPDLPRLRLSSIDSIEIDQELIDLLAYEKRIMPYLHLSLQAGSNMILKRMKRRHLRENAIQFCQDLRAKRPTMVYGADLIAGFPTETEEMFQNSLTLIDECNLTHLHVFPFSPRKGTPAARMPQVNREIIKIRAEKLRTAGKKAYQKHLAHLTNSQQTILIEKDEIGRTEDYTLTHIKGTKAGTIIKALIIGHDGNKLIAEHTKWNAA